MSSTAQPLPARIRSRLALFIATALAALGVGAALQADQASAASLNCWTKGAYINPGTMGTWHNTFSHKVVCNLPVSVHARLKRYNWSTGKYTDVYDYWSTANTNPSPGTFVNQGHSTAPLFCGSSYLVTVTASAANAGATTYDSGWRRYC